MGQSGDSLGVARRLGGGRLQWRAASTAGTGRAARRKRRIRFCATGGRRVRADGSRTGIAGLDVVAVRGPGDAPRGSTRGA
jgi:hypothetical protein